MKLYTKEQVAKIHGQNFAFILIDESNHVLKITLDRAKKKNALHPQMINEIAFALHYAFFENNIWSVLFEAKGDVFCAGADLKAMAGMVEENESTIPLPEGQVLIGELFNKLYKPTIAKVTGDVYAGGFFFLAGSTIVVAQDDIKLGLPEVKRGLFPFQVMAALCRVMSPRKVLDWCIRAYNLPVHDAKKYGLISHVCDSKTIDTATEKIIEEIMINSPTAISKGLEAFDNIYPTSAEHQYLYEMLMQTISSKDGQEGLRAFREKRKPNWLGE